MDILNNIIDMLYHTDKQIIYVQGSGYSDKSDLAHEFTKKLSQTQKLMDSLTDKHTAIYFTQENPLIYVNRTPPKEYADIYIKNHDELPKYISQPIDKTIIIDCHSAARLFSSLKVNTKLVIFCTHCDKPDFILDETPYEVAISYLADDKFYDSFKQTYQDNPAQTMGVTFHRSSPTDGFDLKSYPVGAIIGTLGRYYVIDKVRTDEIYIARMLPNNQKVMFLDIKPNDELYSQVKDTDRLLNHKQLTALPYTALYGTKFETLYVEFTPTDVQLDMLKQIATKRIIIRK